jgi:hypothetical protein
MDVAVLLDDPVEQMKWVMSFVLARLHFTIEQRNPFNPILGETFEAFIDSCPIYLEQISHHPRVAALQFYGRGYTIDATLESVGAISVNTFKAGYAGLERITFHRTGQTYYIRYPWGLVEGVLYGKRLQYFCKSLRIMDAKHHLYGRLKFNFEQKSMFNVWSHRKEPYDAFIGSISELAPAFVDRKLGELALDYKAKLNPKAAHKDFVKEICKATGTALTEIKFDGKEYWEIDMFKPYRLVQSRTPLPSDSNFRPDVLWLMRDDLDKAQVAKDELEDLQRKDKKLRLEHEKQMKEKPGTFHIFK